VITRDLGTRIVVRAALIVTVLGSLAAMRYHADVVTGLHVAGLVALVLAAVRVTWSAVRFARCPRRAKLNYPRMLL